MSRIRSIVVAVAMLASSAALAVGGTAPASSVKGWDRQAPSAQSEKQYPAKFRNCTNLHRVWPHGVGKRHAHDHTTGTPVRNFKRSNKIYKRAMRFNSDLDRDRDKIACEQA